MGVTNIIRAGEFLVGVGEAVYDAIAAEKTASANPYNDKTQLLKTWQNSPHDPTNNPSRTLIGGILLPPDTLPFIDGKKIVVISKVLDGVSVVEHIGREPYSIEFECVLREYTPQGEINTDCTSSIFPMDMLVEVWQKIWLPNTVQKIENTYLNRLGVREMVIETVTPNGYRGSKNIGFRIKGIENVPGTTLIIK